MSVHAKRWPRFAPLLFDGEWSGANLGQRFAWTLIVYGERGHIAWEGGNDAVVAFPSRVKLLRLDGEYKRTVGQAVVISSAMGGASSKHHPHKPRVGHPKADPRLKSCGHGAQRAAPLHEKEERDDAVSRRRRRLA